MVRRRSAVRFREGAPSDGQMTQAAGELVPSGGVAQGLEHSAHNRVVGGSNPPAATKGIFFPLPAYK